MAQEKYTTLFFGADVLQASTAAKRRWAIVAEVRCYTAEIVSDKEEACQCVLGTKNCFLGRVNFDPFFLGGESCRFEFFLGRGIASIVLKFRG